MIRFEQAVEYRVFSKKQRKSQIVFFTKMAACPHLLTLCFTAKQQSTAEHHVTTKQRVYPVIE